MPGCIFWQLPIKYWGVLGYNAKQVFSSVVHFAVTQPHSDSGSVRVIASTSVRVRSNAQAKAANHQKEFFNRKNCWLFIFYFAWGVGVARRMYRTAESISRGSDSSLRQYDLDKHLGLCSSDDQGWVEQYRMGFFSSLLPRKSQHRVLFGYSLSTCLHCVSGGGHSSCHSIPLKYTWGSWN